MVYITPRPPIAGNGNGLACSAPWRTYLRRVLFFLIWPRCLKTQERLFLSPGKGIPKYTKSLSTMIALLRDPSIRNWMGRKLGRMGRKLDLGIFKLLIRMGRTLLRKVPIGRRSHRGKEKKVSSSGFPKFRNRGITQSMPPINLFRTAQSRHCIPSIMPEGKPQSPSIKRWGVELGSILETSNSRHMNKPMRESY